MLMGCGVMKGGEICDIVLSYFNELFSVCDGEYDHVISCVKPSVSSVDNDQMLLAPFFYRGFSQCTSSDAFGQVPWSEWI